MRILHVIMGLGLLLVWVIILLCFVMKVFGLVVVKCKEACIVETQRERERERNILELYSIGLSGDLFSYLVYIAKEDIDSLI